MPRSRKPRTDTLQSPADDPADSASQSGQGQGETPGQGQKQERPVATGVPKRPKGRPRKPPGSDPVRRTMRKERGADLVSRSLSISPESDDQLRAIVAARSAAAGHPVTVVSVFEDAIRREYDRMGLGRKDDTAKS